MTDRMSQYSVVPSEASSGRSRIPLINKGLEEEGSSIKGSIPVSLRPGSHYRDSQ
jgi:hypothetical protein